MMNYKYILAAGTAILLPVSVAADTCSTLPSCDSIGFTYSAADCGALKKLKCPFGDAYFCSGNNCKSVSLNVNTEVCTKYCEEDKNVCVEKRSMNCSELLSKNNCEKVTNGAKLSGTKTKDLCLFGTATNATGYSQSLTLAQITIWDAGLRFPECESEMTGRAKLDLGSVSITNYARFNVEVDISSLSYSQSSKFYSLYFGRNSNINVYYTPSSYSGSTLYMYFEKTYLYSYPSDIDDESYTENNVNVFCTVNGDSWSRESTCDVDINNYDANVHVCTELINDYDCGDNWNSSCYGNADGVYCSNGDSGVGTCEVSHDSWCAYDWQNY